MHAVFWILIALVIIAIIVLVVLYVLYPQWFSPPPPVQKSYMPVAAATTPTTTPTTVTTPATTPTSTPAPAQDKTIASLPAGTSPIPPAFVSKCKTANSYYRDAAYSTWTASDRNTAIWLINHFSPKLLVTYLSGLANEKLHPILANLCGKPIDCKAKNSAYVSKAYTSWTAADRNTAIWLLNQNGSNLTLLQAMTNEQLDPLIKSLCM
jgi:hypothetical protein